MASVAYQNATCQYPGNPIPAVASLDLDVEDGEFMVLVGPSGSGKSTALRMLAGLETVTSGEIHIGGRDVSREPPKARDIAMVFQNYALYPNMTVGENMAFALKLAKMPKPERQERVRTVARMLDLEQYVDRKPRALSGGQRQRVAMGRAIVREPAVFLMDEPLSNLDAKLRVETRANIAALQRRLGTTTLYVTHDQVEAMTMGDRVAVLRDGVLQQADTPRALYDRPDNAFVAGFIGSPAMNLRLVPLVDGGVRLGGQVLPLPRTAVPPGEDHVVVGIRPESLTPVGAEDAGLKLEVTLVEELGADAYVHGRLVGDSGDEPPVQVRVDGHRAPQLGETITVSLPRGVEHVFHAGNGARLV